MLISKSYFRFLSFTFFCFITCYLITFLFPNYFSGTDSSYYLLLVEKNINFEKLATITSFTEPFFYILSRITALLDNPKLSLEFIRIISLFLKSLFFTSLLNNSKNKYFFAVLTSILYFMAFYNRSELGSLRNCFGINIMQYILFFNNTARSYFLAIFSGFFHFPTSFSLLPYLTLISYKSISKKSPIENFKDFFVLLKNWKIYIPKSIKFKFIFIFLILIISMLVLFINRPFYFNSIINLLNGLGGAFYLRTINPFTYYRFYIHIFTLLGLIIPFYNNSIPQKNVKNKFNLSIENNIYLLFCYTTILFLFSYTPLSTLVQRTSYISMYICFSLSMYYISKYLDNINKLKVKYFLSLISFFISLSLILGSTYKYFNMDKYIESVEIQILEFND